MSRHAISIRGLSALVVALALTCGSPSMALRPTTAHGDFDGDGVPDLARVVRDADRHYRVVVEPGSQVQRRIVVYDYGLRRADFYVSGSTPGRYETACHKGYGPDAHEGQPCADNFVVLQGDVLSFGVSESSDAVALWTGRGFRVVWMTD